MIVHDTKMEEIDNPNFRWCGGKARSILKQAKQSKANGEAYLMTCLAFYAEYIIVSVHIIKLVMEKSRVGVGMAGAQWEGEAREENVLGFYCILWFI